LAAAAAGITLIQLQITAFLADLVVELPMAALLVTVAQAEAELLVKEMLGEQATLLQPVPYMVLAAAAAGHLRLEPTLRRRKQVLVAQELPRQLQGLPSHILAVAAVAAIAVVQLAVVAALGAVARGRHQEMELPER